MRVVIVGGGWAGLAAGVRLARAGCAVTVLEAADELGGRARTVSHALGTLDNGQHLLLGAYRHLRELLREVGAREEALWRRAPFEVAVASLPPLRLRGAQWFPRASLFVRAQGLHLRERAQLLRLMLAARRPPTQDLPLPDWLAAQGQSPHLINALWSPLARAALNTPPAVASTQLFCRALAASFAGAHTADLLLPRVGLSAVWPLPARAFIERHGGQVLTHTRATSLVFEGGRVRAVETTRGRFACEHVAIATAPKAATALLSDAALAPLRAQIEKLTPSPIATVYVQYPLAIGLPDFFLGLLDGPADWVFDRGHTHAQAGLMAAVLSGPSAAMNLSREALADSVIAQLARHFPAWPAPRAHFVVREKQATFLAHAGVQALRPPARTPLKNLWLAGDYVAGEYPATLEGAVTSGIECARLILSD